SKIAAHSHRKLRQRNSALGLQAIAEFSEPGKKVPRALGGWLWRRGAPQTLDFPALPREQRFHFFAPFLLRKTALAALACDVHFDEHARKDAGFRGDALHVARNLQRVDSVRQLEERQRVADLVFLKMADEVPAGPPWNEWDFSPSLLHTALSEDHL